MALRRYIEPVNGRAVLYGWLGVLAVLAQVWVLPLFLAVLLGDGARTAVFGATAAVALLLSLLRKRLSSTTIEMREALVVAGLSYVTFALAGAAAFATVAPPLDAFFEAMSGFTTTGLSVLVPEELPVSLQFFRAYSQWIGGAGIMVISVALVFGTGRTGLSLGLSEAARDDVIGSVRASTRAVRLVYAILTASAFLLLWATGAPAADAALDAMATVSTGGFSHHAQSVGFYSGVVRAAFVPAMLLGATSMPLLYRARRAGWRTVARNGELRALLALFTGATVLAIVFGDNDAGQAAFHVASAVTTTGAQLSDPHTWPAGTWAIVVVLMVIGGSSGSTAGGLKLRRVLTLVSAARNLLLRSALPREAQVPLRSGDTVVDSEEENLLLSFFVIYLLALVLSTVALLMGGFAPGAALFESASALGTVGYSAGVTSPELAWPLKLVLIFDMWAGRLEVLPVLLVLSPRTWARTRTGEESS